MKAVQITTLDGPDAITVGHVPAPVAGDGQVLIDVRAAGVAFPEVLQTRGEYQIKPDLPFVPGAEVAGDEIGRASCRERVGGREVVGRVDIESSSGEMWQ